MRTVLSLVSPLMVASGLVAGGCATAEKPSDTLAEGVIYYVVLRTEDGRTEGFTRINEPKLVPAQSGSWNVDAYGRLTREFLFVTRPQQKDLGEEVIPVSRLLKIQFGDGGITHVDENRPKLPGK